MKRINRVYASILVVFTGLLVIFSGAPDNRKLVDIKDLDLNGQGKSKDIQPINDVKGVKPRIDHWTFPLYFIVNKGQVNEKAKFYAKASRYTLWSTKEGLVFDSMKKQGAGGRGQGAGHPSQEGNPEYIRDVSRLMFIGANKNPGMVPVEQAKLKVNYFIGNDKSRWHCDVPTSMAVLYKELYKNIDLKVYGIERQIEYDWIVKPGGDPLDIKFRYTNVKGTRIDEQGNLLIETDFGELMHKKPVSYQDISMGHGARSKEERTSVDVKFKRISGNTYGFAVGAYDGSRELVIDPVVLAYSTYLGGGSSDQGNGIAVDGSGYIYVTGGTASSDFPTRNAYNSTGSNDAFISKLDPSQSGDSSLIYSTYLGGSSDDLAIAIAVDSSGNAYVTGATSSTNFPTRNEYQLFQGSADMFVTRLDTTQSGSAGLIYSTYLGGSGSDFDLNTGNIAVDGSGNAYVTGMTNSTNFPTRNQYQTDQGGEDVFFTKLDTNQSGDSSLLYSTYLGGSATDRSYGITVDASGNAYVSGGTWSNNFPTLNPYQTDQGDVDAFVTKLDPTQSGPSSLLYSTYLGGGAHDRGGEIVVDGSGNFYLAGWTSSTDFPTQNPYQGNQGGDDMFVTKFAANGSSLVYSTYLGGGNWDRGIDIAVDGSDNAYVIGYTLSTDFPTLNQYQTDPGDSAYDVFVTKLAATGSSLIYSTYLGGGGEDISGRIAIDGSGNAYVTGYTASTDFPTLNQYQGNQVGDDAFVTRLSFGDPPTVDTPTSAAVTYTTADLGGNVSSTNGINVTERGVYWSTTNGFTPPGQGTKVSETGNWGTGVFTVNVTGLPAGTTIYFQAFATNAAGTGYSAQASFATPAITAPTVTTTAVSNITSTTADSGGNVTSNGGAAVTARGVCWSTSPNPTTANNTTSDGTGTGSFTSSLTGLSPGTTYYVSAYATNSVGTSYGSEVSFTTSTALATVTTSAVINITLFTADSGGNVTADGGAAVTARGVCWSTSPNPTTADNTTGDGTGTGSFTSSLTGLTPGTTYHVRAYAVNSVGTAYGGDVSFTTTAPGMAVVSTAAVSNITSTTASGGGNVTDDGGAAVTARGVCWSTSPNPTTADSFTGDGSGTGSFTSSISGLSPGTTYHVRAYATNSAGTSYGNDVSFTTLNTASVTTAAVSNITATSAGGGGNVTSDGGAAVTSRGLCWNTSPNPTTANSKTINGSGTGAFTGSLTGLTPDTTYYVRAYATNSVGTAYGSDVSFVTSDNPTISGRITDGTSGIQGVTLTFSNGGGSTVTLADGTYSHTVTYGWSGTVTPAKTGYTLSPANRSYSNLTSNQTNQDFTASLIGLTISGKVTVSGTGLAGVSLTFSSGGSITTLADGTYSHTVNYGWTGTVTPTKAGYKFSPADYSYSNLTSNQTNRDFTASLISLTISGKVTNANGTGVPGVTLAFSNQGGSTTTAADGSYSHTVNNGWSGSVAPSKDGYEFNPTQRNYSNVQANQANQDYTAAAITPVISGKVTSSGTGVPGVTLTFSNGAGTTTTASDGTYSHTVTYGWSGSVTPSKYGYEFNPAQRHYTGVQRAHTNQDYEASLLEFEISGKISKVTNTGGSPLPGVTLTFQAADGTMATVITDAAGEYSHKVPYGWWGSVTPSRSNYGFSPEAMHYTGIDSDKPNQDYSAFPEVTQTYTISGGVRTADGSGLRGVILVFSNDGGYAVTDTNGEYNRTVNEAWAGTITPSLSGYAFDPPRRSYPGVLTDLSNQDYTANAVPLEISGRVHDSRGTGISGVTVTFFDSVGGESKDTFTDFNGNYRAAVDHGWSGTVTPTKDGYEFEPAHRTYENLAGDRLNQDYEGTVSAGYPVISGMVTDSQGVGIAGVTVTFSGDGGTSSASTDANGNYSHPVEPGWSGTAEPSKQGYVFDPSRIRHDNVMSDLHGQDYIGTSIFPVIAGMVKTPLSTGLPGVFLEFTGTAPAGTTQTYTNTMGTYTQTVPFGWTGTVTPARKGYEFQPSFLPYEDVNTDQLNQDYVTTTMLLFICGRVATPEGEGVADIVLTFSNGGGTAVTYETGEYVNEVDFGWSGTVTPSSDKYTFEPPFLEFPRVDRYQYDQNFTAHEIPPVISGRVTRSTPSGIIGLADVSLNFSGISGPAVTDQDGYYAHSVPKGWSGSITPEHHGYVFFPTSQYYTGVISDMPDQNFTSIPTNFSLRLEGKRIVSGPLMIKKHFAEISLTLERIGDIPAGSYVILRREKGGIYRESRVIPGSQLELGDTYTYHDGYLDRKKTYSYKAIVKDAAGRIIGASNEVEI